MKLLLDENVPVPITSTVKTLLRRSHDVQHVIDLDGWNGTKDLHLYGEAKDAGFEVVVTDDAKQMNRRLEVEAIARSGLHRIQYPHRQNGLAGLGVAMATVCAASAIPILPADRVSTEVRATNADGPRRSDQVNLGIVRPGRLATDRTCDAWSPVADPA